MAPPIPRVDPENIDIYIYHHLRVDYSISRVKLLTWSVKKYLITNLRMKIFLLNKMYF